MRRQYYAIAKSVLHTENFISKIYFDQSELPYQKTCE